jgi:glycosyltransferase involved in cell wall biosynthesis
MRIGITVDPYYPVPPLQYGGIERIVDFVARGLAARGHTITMFAHPNSKIVGELIGYGVPPHQGRIIRMCELAQLGGALLRRHRQFDVLLSWGRLAALVPVLPFRHLPKIQRYCRDAVPWRSVTIASRLARDSIRFVGSSESVYMERSNNVPLSGNWQTIYDGVEVEKYLLVPEVPIDAPLAFLGRLDLMKGVHTAIAVAKKANRRLIIAGNKIENEAGLRYFRQEIEPYIDDNQIKYVGPVNDKQKNELLGHCAALLFPTLYKEGFGIVMAEAMACGVPVLGHPCGSVKEVVRQGVTGYVCANVAEYVEAVREVHKLNRSSIRKECEKRFSATNIVNQFERLCLDMVEASNRI